MQIFNYLFSTDGFVPRWFCGKWDTFHGYLHICSDVAVGLAYYSIPALLFYISYKKINEFNRLIVLFGAFIISCGTVHILDAYIFYNPVYNLLGLLKFLTAAISWFTVIYLFLNLKKILDSKIIYEVDSITQTIPNLVWTCGPDGKATYYSQQWKNYTGARLSKLYGEGWLNFLHPDDRIKAKIKWDECAKDKTFYEIEYRIRNREGEYRWFSVRGNPIFEANDKTIKQWYGTCTDIHDLKLKKEAMELTKRKINKLIYSTGQVIWNLDPITKRPTEDSESWRKFTGQSKEDFLAGKFCEYLYPDDIDIVKECWDEANTYIGNEFNCKFRLKHFDGQYRWVMAKAISLKIDNKVKEWIGSCTDIHDMVIYEQNLKQTNKDLEMFAYLAAHDLQDPLRQTSAFSRLLIKSTTKEEIDKYSKIIINSVDKMKKMTSNLLEYSKDSQKELQLQKCDLNIVLSNIVKDLSLSLKESKSEIFVSNLPTIKCDEIQISRLFLNLFQNSIKYRSPERKLIITVTYQEEELDHVILVSDNAIGISKEDIPKLFVIYRRVRKDDKGVGFGLATCKKIIEKHHGSISVNSELGKGSTFKIVLPK